MTLTLDTPDTDSRITEGPLSVTDDRLGETLRRAREAAGLSQSRLAARMVEAGMSGATVFLVGRVEMGQRPCRATELVAFAQGLGTTPEALLYAASTNSNAAAPLPEESKGGPATGIAAAACRAEQIHTEQLRAAESSDEERECLRNARLRAALRVAGTLGFGPLVLKYLITLLITDWTPEFDHAVVGDPADFFDSLPPGAEDLINEKQKFNSAWHILMALWPDIVLETEEWARRV
jgi:transcriptional regulator with XRE-family HTH domain